MHSNESQLITSALISYRVTGVPQGHIIGPLYPVFAGKSLIMFNFESIKRQCNYRVIDIAGR